MKESGSSVVIAGGLAKGKTKNLLDILASIEQFSFAERGSTTISEEAVTKIMIFHYLEAGFLFSFSTAIWLIATVPFGVLVRKSILPIFNSTFNSWYDQLFALLLSLLPALSGALIFSYIISRSYWGAVTSKLVSAVASGMIVGYISAGLIAFLVHLFLALQVYRFKLTFIYNWYFKIAKKPLEIDLNILLAEVFLQSALFIVFVVWANILLILWSMRRAKNRSKAIDEIKQFWV